MAVLKDRVIGKMAKFLREAPRMKKYLRYQDGKCVMCGALPDELHDSDCPMYHMEGVRMDLNLLFYGIKTPEEAARNPKAL